MTQYPNCLVGACVRAVVLLQYNCFLVRAVSAQRTAHAPNGSETVVIVSVFYSKKLMKTTKQSVPSDSQHGNWHVKKIKVVNRTRMLLKKEKKSESVTYFVCCTQTGGMHIKKKNYHK